MAQSPNYDEAKVPDFELPELLKLANGQAVNSVTDWETKRRLELLRQFETLVYGKLPTKSININFSPQSMDRGALEGKATRKEIQITIRTEKGQLHFNLLLFTPNSSEKAPVFLGYNFYGNHTIHSDQGIRITKSWVRNNEAFGITENKATAASRGVRASRWPVEAIIDRGYGLATIYYGDVDPDFDDGFANGLHPLFYEEGQQQPKADEWGSIGAWSDALIKALDYLQTDQNVKADQVMVIGHSRLGKTALYAGALDERFRIVYSNNSGCGGAALSKRKFGETVGVINTKFPHWFCGNFKNYNEKEEVLPVDQHMLIALMAPRPIYVASASEDQWADPMGEFLAAKYASPIYKLYGKEGLKLEAMPAVNTPSKEGSIGYHLRAGKHDITLYDWIQYMDFADRHLK